MFNPLKNNLETSILNVIFETDAVTAKKIFFRVRKEHTVSYQYVHRVLQHLTDEEILIKDRLRYCINPTWVVALKSRIEDFVK